MSSTSHSELSGAPPPGPRRLDLFGRDVDDRFVAGQIAAGAWRLITVPPGLSGIARPMEILVAKRASQRVKYGWHGDAATFCPPMWADIAIGSGACGFGCRSCFLMLTHRALRDPLRPLVYDNVTDFERDVAAWLSAKRVPLGDGKNKKWVARTPKQAIGLGIDCADSLLWEGVTGIARTLIPLFTSAESNTLQTPLILLTKSANTHFLAELTDAQLRRADGRVPNVAVTMSLNPEGIADLWEGKFPDTLERITPPIATRLEALRAAQDLGFEVRIRVDPILTPAGWQEQYAEFFHDVASRFGLRPTMITLGTYREKTPQLDTWRAKWGLPEMEWQPETDVGREGTHVHAAGRAEAYGAVEEIIARAFGGTGHTPWVSLCKETHAVRKSTGLVNANCNCLRETAPTKRRLEVIQ